MIVKDHREDRFHDSLKLASFLCRLLRLGSLADIFLIIEPIKTTPFVLNIYNPRRMRVNDGGAIKVDLGQETNYSWREGRYTKAPLTYHRLL